MIFKTHEILNHMIQFKPHNTDPNFTMQNTSDFLSLSVNLIIMQVFFVYLWWTKICRDIDLPLIVIETRAHFYKISLFLCMKIKHMLPGYLVIFNHMSVFFFKTYISVKKKYFFTFLCFMLYFNIFVWYCKHTQCCSCLYAKLLTFCMSNGIEKKALLSYISITDSCTFQTLTIFRPLSLYRERNLQSGLQETLTERTLSSKGNRAPWTNCCVLAGICCD